MKYYGDELHPIELNSVTITYNKKGYLDKILDFINDEIFLNRDNIRTNNINNNPNALDNFDIAKNVTEFTNISSLGLINRFSPTQNIRLMLDAFKGNNIIDSWFGNNGIVSDNFADSYPKLSFAINGIADLGTTSFSLKPFDYGQLYKNLSGKWNNFGSESYVRLSDNVVHKIPQKPLKYKFQIPFAVRSKLNANRYNSQVPYTYKGYLKNKSGYYPIYEQSKVEIPPRGSILETKAYNDVISSNAKEPLRTKLQYNIFDIDIGHNIGILNGKGVMYDPILSLGIVPPIGSWVNRNFIFNYNMLPILSGLNGLIVDK